VVEKIKVVGCTYMAACGLDFNLASNVRQSSHIRHSSLHIEGKSLHELYWSFNPFVFVLRITFENSVLHIFLYPLLVE